MAPPDLPDNRSTDRLIDLEKRMDQTNRDFCARLDQHSRDINDLKCIFSRLEDYLREMDAKLSLLTKEDWGEISNPTISVAEGAISKSAIGIAEEARTTLVEVDVTDLKVNENDSNKKESSNNDEVAADANRIVEAIAEEGTRGHCVEEMKPSSKPIVPTNSKLQEQLMFPRYLPRNLVTIPALFSVHKTLQTSTTLVTSLILPPFVTDRTHNSRASRVSLILGPKFDSLLELLEEKPSSQNHTLFKSQASNPPSTFAMNTALFAFSMFAASLPSPKFLGPLGASLSTYYFDSVSDILLGYVFSGYFTLVYLWQAALGTEIETLSLDHYIIVLFNSINTNSMTIVKVFWEILGRDVEGLGSYFGSLLSMLITPSLAVCVRIFEDLHRVWSDFISIKPKKFIRQFNFSPVVDVVDVNIMRYESSWDDHKKLVQRQLGFSYLVAYESGVFVEDLGYIAGYYMIEHSYAARMFYFFESRNSNQNPFVLWGRGGLGYSSELAMSYETDPFKSANNMFLLWIDYGRDRVPNLLYGDQLNGNGFSYTTANDVDTWYNEFFAEYYIPVLTAQLHRENNAKEGSHINMKDYCGVLGILLPIAFVFYLFFLLNEELKAKFVGALQVVMGFGFLLGFTESFPPVFASLNSKQGPPIKNGLSHSVFVLCCLDALLKLPFLKLQQWVLYGLTWSVTVGLHTEGTFNKLGF